MSRIDARLIPTGRLPPIASPGAIAAGAARWVPVQQKRPPSGEVVLWAVFGLLSLGLLALAVTLGTPMRFVDERQYVDIASNLAAGNGFRLDGRPTAYRPPIWPALLALAIFAGLPISSLAVVSAGFMVAAAFAATSLCRRLVDSRWAPLAGIAMLVFPVNVYTATTVYPQSLATFCVVVLWLIAHSLVDQPRTRTTALKLAVASGLIAAVLALSVPLLAFTGVAVIVAMSLLSRGKRLPTLLLAMTAFVIPIAAWTVRNSVVLGHVVPISTSNGINLLIGNNASATGASGLGVDIDDTRRAGEAFVDEVARDAYFRELAVGWITENPRDAVELYVAKLLNYFSPYNEPVTSSASAGAYAIIAYVSFAVLVLLVAVRLALRGREPVLHSELAFLAIFLLNAPVMAVFFTRVRFRQPLDAILIVEATIAIVVLLRLRTAGRAPAEAADPPC